jgi:hypothetical protein
MRRLIHQEAVFFINLRHEIIGTPDVSGAFVNALEMMNGAMALVHGGLVKTSALELPVYVAGKHTASMCR